MAIVSKVAKPVPGAPSHKTGASREGDSLAMLSSQSAESNFTMRSSNGMPSSVIASQGRANHDE